MTNVALWIVHRRVVNRRIVSIDWAISKRQNVGVQEIFIEYFGSVTIAIGVGRWITIHESDRTQDPYLWMGVHGDRIENITLWVIQVRGDKSGIGYPIGHRGPRVHHRVVSRQDGTPVEIFHEYMPHEFKWFTRNGGVYFVPACIARIIVDTVPVQIQKLVVVRCLNGLLTRHVLIGQKQFVPQGDQTIRNDAFCIVWISIFYPLSNSVSALQSCFTFLFNFRHV